MTDKKHSTASTTDRRPDCVTETRMGNTVLIVSGYFKKDTTATAADKMMKVKRKPQPHQDRPTPHEPEHGKAVMLGSMTAGMGVRTETYLKVTSSFLADLIAYSFRTTMYPLASISSTFLSNPFAFSASMVFPPIGINRRGLFSDGAYE